METFIYRGFTVTVAKHLRGLKRLSYNIGQHSRAVYHSRQQFHTLAGAATNARAYVDCLIRTTR